MSEKTKTTSPPKRRWARIVAWVFGSLAMLLLLLVVAASYYTTTADFQRRVGGEVVSILETATGGKVEVGHISFNLWHLAVEVDGLVIHGYEPAGEMPYLSADKILVRVLIHTFLSHAAGGPKSHVGLSFLRVENPHYHLIIDKDGKTNQPTPKKPSTSTTPIQDTLLDLQAARLKWQTGLR